jgi:branched-chain amino acid transport system substrate-binding protein
MKKIKILLAISVIAFTITGCNSIGVIIPLTGDYAKIGADIKKAIEIAEQDAVIQGLVKKDQIKVIFEDNRLDATVTMNAYNKLKSLNNIQAVITVTSKCILALKPLINKNKTLLLNASAISTEIEDSSDYCFSLIPNAEAESIFMSEYIYKNKKINNTAIVYRNDQSGKSFQEEFAKHYLLNGGSIPITEAHPINTTDFKTIITKIKSKENVKAVFMASLGVEIANFMKQSKELDLNIPIFTYETINQPNALDIAGSLIDKVEFVSPKFFPQDTIFNTFRHSLKNQFGTDEINFYMTSHYNAYMLIARLISSGNRTGDEFKANIPLLGNFKSLGYEISIDSIGNASTALGIYGFNQKQIFLIN